MKQRELILTNIILAIICLIVLASLVLHGLVVEALIPLMLLIIIILNYNVIRLYFMQRRLILAYSKLLERKRKINRILKKPRRRYLIFRVISNKEVKEEALRSTILTKFREIIGDLGLSQANIKLILYDPKGGYGILRFNHTERDVVLLCLALIRSVNGVKVSIIPWRTTGTIKRAQEILKSLTLD